MITASIVTYKTDKAELTTALNCTCKSSIEKIWVIDNSPSNELLSVVSNFSPKIEYIWGHGNVGYGSAHNIAIRKAIELNAKYHVVVNPDIEFECNAINTLVAYMDQNKNVGQVMPKIISPDGKVQNLCKLLPSPMDLIGRRFIPIKSFVDGRNKRYEMIDSGYNKIINVPFLSGCFMFLRTSALEKVGGFDDSFFMYCEDIDLCRRINIVGYETTFFPDTSVVHAHKKESFKNRKMLKAHIKSAIRYFNKWGWIFDKYRKEINKNVISQYKSDTIV